MTELDHQHNKGDDDDDKNNDDDEEEDAEEEGSNTKHWVLARVWWETEFQSLKWVHLNLVMSRKAKVIFWHHNQYHNQIK